jgi:hypothetical protein
MRIAPTKLSNASPNIFSEPILRFENLIGSGSYPSSLSIFLNYATVLSISSKSMKIKS